MNATREMPSPVSPGALAPDFALAAVDGSGTISLQDYRGKNPLFLALFVGLWCPFCRRSIAEMAATEPTLKKQGVETLCIVATPPENARLYFKYRPTRLRLAADPELTTHRAYGVPKPVPTPELMTAIETVRINPDGVLPEPLPMKAWLGWANSRRATRSWPRRGLLSASLEDATSADFFSGCVIHYTPGRHHDAIVSKRSLD